jgi:predicted DNA-binding transcriptional regulator AlpA
MANTPTTILDPDWPLLPEPDGRPVPLFFGRRFLSFRDLVAIGFVGNWVTLNRLMAEGRFPRPLKLGQQLRLWDALELQDQIDRLKAERDQQQIETTAAPDAIPATDAAQVDVVITDTTTASQRGPP